MKLTAAQTTEIQRKLREKNALKPCYECGGNNFESTSDRFDIESSEYSPDNQKIIGGAFSVKPVFVVTCKNCGAIKLFDLITILGIGGL